MRTLHKRLLISAILVPMAIYGIFIAPFWFFAALIMLFALIGFYEFLDLANKKGVTINRYLALALAAVVPFATMASVEIAYISLVTLALFVYHFKIGYQQRAFMDSMITVFGILYVVLFFCQFLKIRALPHGSEWVFYTILIVKGGDAGAYFTGRKIGKTKLIEHISPNKSVEGSVGGFLTTIALSILSKIYLPHAPIGHLLFMGICLGVLSQFGDLAESLLKRDAGIKDSGTIPGLGGILDVLDSLLFSAPFVFAYLYIFSGTLASY